jgi:hypothetical protein
MDNLILVAIKNQALLKDLKGCGLVLRVSERIIQLYILGGVEHIMEYLVATHYCVSELFLNSFFFLCKFFEMIEKQ